jgi:hypothetical protein
MQNLIVEELSRKKAKKQNAIVFSISNSANLFTKVFIVVLP